MFPLSVYQASEMLLWLSVNGHFIHIIYNLIWYNSALQWSVFHCQQYVKYELLLYFSMTVEEHMEFYSAIKSSFNGLSAKDEIRRWVKMRGSLSTLYIIIEACLNLHLTVGSSFGYLLWKNKNFFLRIQLFIFKL